jgi:hypothetical protein
LRGTKADIISSEKKTNQGADMLINVVLWLRPGRLPVDWMRTLCIERLVPPHGEADIVENRENQRSPFKQGDVEVINDTGSEEQYRLIDDYSV